MTESPFTLIVISFTMVTSYRCPFTVLFFKSIGLFFICSNFAVLKVHFITNLLTDAPAVAHPPLALRCWGEFHAAFIYIECNLQLFTQISLLKRNTQFSLIELLILSTIFSSNTERVLSLIIQTTYLSQLAKLCPNPEYSCPEDSTCCLLADGEF